MDWLISKCWLFLPISSDESPMQEEVSVDSVQRSKLLQRQWSYPESRELFAVLKGNAADHQVVAHILDADDVIG